jgi:hypothetical protein
MRRDGRYKVCIVVVCVRRTKEDWAALRLGRAERGSARTPEAIGLETFRRRSMALTLLSHNGRHVCRRAMTATPYIVL